jgi:site-specific DNA recombinase
LRVAIYARVSTGSDEQENALEQQIARLEAAATANGDNEPLRYIDIDSGFKDDRPELSRLIRDCGAGLMNTVVVTRLDRLSRSSSHGAELLRYFSQDNSPSLVALDDSLDLSTSGGRFMARMLISWAEAETDRLAERLKAGFKHRRDQRKPATTAAATCWAQGITTPSVIPERLTRHIPIGLRSDRRWLQVTILL